MSELKKKIKLELDTYDDNMVSANDCINQIISLCMDEAIESLLDFRKCRRASSHPVSRYSDEIYVSDAIKTIRGLK